MEKKYTVILIIFFIAIIFMKCGNKYDLILEKVVVGKANFTGTSGRQLSSKFIYSVPNNYNPKKSYPLIVSLHGHGGNAEAFHDLWQSSADSLGFVLLVPEGDVLTEEGFGYGWSENTELSVKVCMDIVQRKINIDRQKLFISGFSSGGSKAYYMGLKYPNIFRGIAALSAPFDKKFIIKSNIVGNLRIYIGHGSLEKRYGEESLIAIEEFKNLGCEVNYTQYDGIGHGLPEPKEIELMKILKYLGR